MSKGDLLEYYINNSNELRKSVPGIDKLSETLRSNGVIEEEDKILYDMPAKNLMTNNIYFSKEKLIVENRGDWSEDKIFNYEDFITFRVLQRKLFFIKMDLSVTPNYDISWGGGHNEFFVWKPFSNTFILLYKEILKIHYPKTFNENTDWESQMARDY